MRRHLSGHVRRLKTWAPSLLLWPAASSTPRLDPRAVCPGRVLRPILLPISFKSTRPLPPAFARGRSCPLHPPQRGGMPTMLSSLTQLIIRVPSSLLRRRLRRLYPRWTGRVSQNLPSRSPALSATPRQTIPRNTLGDISSFTTHLEWSRSSPDPGSTCLGRAASSAGIPSTFTCQTTLPPTLPRMSSQTPISAASSFTATTLQLGHHPNLRLGRRVRRRVSSCPVTFWAQAYLPHRVFDGTLGETVSGGAEQRR
mmetsp:Transcript_21967/g.44440  ORF Transcript_21967/g.44440 Transcript_21967/m.44440 type:complete len:255 (-) Transcript_21967:35-799(-)